MSVIIIIPHAGQHFSHSIFSLPSLVCSGGEFQMFPPPAALPSGGPFLANSGTN